MKSALYVGKTDHKRFLPKIHAFSYPLFMFAFDLDELAALDHSLWGFGYNRNRIFSLHDKDYLREGNTAIKSKLLSLISEFGKHPKERISKVVLLTTPRFFTKVFNPVSFYYCYSDQKELLCVCAEVTNTYHEKQFYLCENPTDDDANFHRFTKNKDFHVSPFFDEAGCYEFKLSPLSDTLEIHITYKKDDKTLFYANLIAKKRPLTKSQLLKLIATFPLTPFLTLPRIVYQAFKLQFFKGIQAKQRPVPTSKTLLRKKNLSLFQKRFESALVNKMLPGLPNGKLHLTLPNGEQRSFGNDTSFQQSIHIKDPRFYSRIAWSGGIGFGESYMHNEWDTPDLTGIMQLMVRNLAALKKPDEGNKIGKVVHYFQHLLNKNTIFKSKKNIEAHYDLGNDFYTLFLDPTKMYSCGIFNSPKDSLEQAQHNKIKHLAEKLHVEACHHVLEIGSGWGSMAIYLAQNHGCKVTTLTLSSEQLVYVQEKIKRLNLTHLVEIRLEDYRLHKGSYDRIISIEMLEAVGEQYLATYFKVCDQRLKKDGIAVIQVITVPDQQYESYRATSDFIRKHIFPGGHLPSLGIIVRILDEHTKFDIEHLENIGPHYAPTLKAWHERFDDASDQVKALGFDDVFIRKWKYYFSYCEAAFAERFLNNIQLVLTRQENTYLRDKGPSNYC